MDTVNSLIVGIVSGIISSLIIYWFTKKREAKYNAYRNLRSFVFMALSKCEIYAPLDILESLKEVDENNEKLKIAITEIIDYIHPENNEEKVYNKEEEKLFANIQIALKELNVISKKNYF